MRRRALWAPWRLEYVRGPKGPGCFLCRALEGGDDRESLILLRGERAFAILNRYPYTAGHLMVVPNRHVAEPEDLAPDEAAALWETLVRAKRAMAEEFGPDGYNVGLNLGRAAGAGLREHLHLHLVPRWAGDTNFMPVVGDVRVVSRHLADIYDSLARRLAVPAPGRADPPPSRE